MTAPKRTKQPPAAKAGALLHKIVAPDGTQFTVPLWLAQGDTIDAATTMTATAVCATAGGVRFDLQDRPTLWHQAPRWPEAWRALRLPRVIVGGKEVVETCQRIEQWIDAQPRRRGERGPGRNHAASDELVATALSKQHTDGLSQRAAVAATLEELAPNIDDNTLHVAMKRALRDSRGD